MSSIPSGRASCCGRALHVTGNADDALPVAAAFDLFDRFLLLHDELANESSRRLRHVGVLVRVSTPATRSMRWRFGASPATWRTRGRDWRPRVSSGRRSSRRSNEATATASRDAVLTAAALEAGAVIAEAPETADAAFANAGRLPGVARYRRRRRRRCVLYTTHDDLAVFEEVARYVARRAI